METCIDKTLKEYIINFSGLSIGEHRFHFFVDDCFFEQIEYSNIKKAKVNVDLIVQREERMLFFDFKINGNINTICDSCGDDLILPINGNKNLIVKFGKTYEEPEENIIIIPENEYQIDVHHHIYEYINLLCPFKKIHPNDGKEDCNIEVLDKIKSLNNTKSIDPRWDQLAKLKNKFDN